jgi:uncharacterized membrane protein
MPVEVALRGHRDANVSNHVPRLQDGAFIVWSERPRRISACPSPGVPWRPTRPIILRISPSQLHTLSGRTFRRFAVRRSGRWHSIHR